MERPKRIYHQYCALARALEIIGERWTLLVIRELLTGPKRYKDLLEGMPGIGTNLLAARLKELERLGLIRRRTLPPPAGSTVYELTKTGEDLRHSVHELERWGLQFLGLPRKDDFFHPTWAVIAMEATFRPELTDGLKETYEFRVDDDVMHVSVDNGTCKTGQGPAWEPDLVVETNSKSFLALASGQLSVEDVLKNTPTEIIQGDTGMLRRAGDIFRLPGPLEAESQSGPAKKPVRKKKSKGLKKTG